MSLALIAARSGDDKENSISTGERFHKIPINTSFTGSELNSKRQDPEDEYKTKMYQLK